MHFPSSQLKKKKKKKNIASKWQEYQNHKILLSKIKSLFLKMGKELIIPSGNKIFCFSVVLNEVGSLILKFTEIQIIFCTKRIISYKFVILNTEILSKDKIAIFIFNNYKTGFEILVQFDCQMCEKNIWAWKIPEIFSRYDFSRVKVSVFSYFAT